RRHTRCYRDWSSDVCSSDLTGARTEISPAELDATQLASYPYPKNLLRDLKRNPSDAVATVVYSTPCDQPHVSPFQRQHGLNLDSTARRRPLAQLRRAPVGGSRNRVNYGFGKACHIKRR